MRPLVRPFNFVRMMGAILWLATGLTNPVAHASAHHCPDAQGPMGIMMCYSNEASQLDKQVNQQYRQVLQWIEKHHLPGEDDEDWHDLKQSLVKSQSAWKIYRDEDCNAVSEIRYPGNGPSAHRVNDFDKNSDSLRCEIDHSEVRLTQLKKMQFDLTHP